MSYPSDPELGWYYVVSVAGEVEGVYYKAGDWIVWNGTSWDKLSGFVTHLQLPVYPTTTVDMIADNNWHIVDISGVYGARKHLVFLHIRVSCVDASARIYFDDNKENFNIYYRHKVANVNGREWVQVHTDSNGIWSYNAGEVITDAKYCILGVLTE